MSLLEQDFVTRRESISLIESVSLSRARRLREAEQNAHELEAEALSTAIPEGFNFQAKRDMQKIPDANKADDMNKKTSIQKKIKDKVSLIFHSKPKNGAEDSI